MNHIVKRGLIVASLTALFCFATSFVADAAEPQAKNVILCIADGMGHNADIMGSYWRAGKADGLA